MRVGSKPVAVALTTDGRRAYVADSGSGTVSVIDMTTTALAGAPITVGGLPRAIALSHDEKRLYVADSATGHVIVVDTAMSTVLGPPVEVGGTPSAIAVSGTRAYVADAGSGTVSVFDTGTGAVVGEPDHRRPGPGHCGGRSRRGTGLHRRRRFRRRPGGDSDTLTVTGRIALPGTPNGLAVSPDGRRLLVTMPALKTLVTVDPASLSVIGSPIPVGGAPHGVTISRDGRRAYVANAASDSLSVVDL